MAMFGKIMCCFDGSHLAEEIIPYAAETSARFAGELIFASVITTQITIPPPQSIHFPYIGSSSSTEHLPVSDISEKSRREPEVGTQLKEIELEQDQTRRYLEKLANPLRSEGLKVTVAILQGDPGEAIVTYSRNNNVSLIALTSHGRGGYRRGIYGSIAQFVLRESEIPVLLVKPHRIVR